MAVDLQKLKRKMRGVTSTRQVTRALQMVSAMKMRKAQDRSEQSRVFRRGLTELMETFDLPPEAVAPELASRPEGREALTMTFASDRGLCGPYNTNVLNVAAAEARRIGRENLEIRAVGIKVGSVLRRRGYRVASAERRPAPADYGSFLDRTNRDLFEAWDSGRYRSIHLVYASLSGMTVVKPVPFQWLPLSGFEDVGSDEPRTRSGGFIDEPGQAAVLAAAVRKHLYNEILTALLQSEAAEHVARMVAMDNATRNAEEMFESLQLTYNKARQAKITQEICEIVAGANAIGG